MKPTWKLGLVLGGAACLLVAGAILYNPSGPGCGDHILNRWSVPTFAVGVGMGAVGATVVALGLTLKALAARRMGQRLLVVAVSIGVTLAAIDVAMRLTEPPYSNQPHLYIVNHDPLGYFFEPRQRYEGLSSANEYHTAMYTDENGIIIRGERNSPRRDAVRMMFLGDSYMAGIEVPAEDNLSVLTEQQMEAATGQDYQALNLGVSGYSPLNHLMAYRTFAPDFDPQIVVVQIYVGNDFTETARLVLDDRVIYDADGNPVRIRPSIDYEHGTAWNNHTLTGRYEDARPRLMSEENWHNGTIGAARELVVKPLCRELSQQAFEPRTYDPQNLTLDPVDSGEELACNDQSGALTVHCVNYAIRETSLVRNNADAIFKDTLTETDRADIQYTLETLRQLAAEVDADERELLVVILPVVNQVPGQGEGVKPRRGMEPDEIIQSTAPQDILLDFCEAEGLSCIDMLPILTRHSDEQLYWIYDVHLTPRGHEVVAGAIVDHLLD